MTGERSARTKDKSLYARARKKRAAGKSLTYAERQRLDAARDRRVAKEDATWKKDHARSMGELPGPRFRMTRRGWRVVIPNDHPGGPWSARDELEIVTAGGVAVWVTLVRLAFTGGDARRSEWWIFVKGRQSNVARHVEAPASAPPPPPEQKQSISLLEDDDDERVSSVAGAAYLNARRKRERSDAAMAGGAAK